MMEKVIAGVSIALTLVTAGLIARNTAENPFEERRERLNSALSRIQPEQVSYLTTSDVDYMELLAGVVNKGTLWRELIPPPPPPPPPAPKIEPPNLREMLQGVVPLLRQQIGTGDTAKVRIKTKQNQRGEFLGVGDKINGVEILRVGDDHVLFGLTKDGRNYSIELKRQ